MGEAILHHAAPERVNLWIVLENWCKAILELYLQFKCTIKLSNLFQTFLYCTRKTFENLLKKSPKYKSALQYQFLISSFEVNFD